MNTTKKAPFSTQDHAQYIIDNCIVIDTETTGLGNEDVAIEIAAVDAKTGTVFGNTLISCDLPMIPQAAYDVHKIGIKDLYSAPTAERVIDELLYIATSRKKKFTAFNVHFDSRIIAQTAAKNELSMHVKEIEDTMAAHCCVMELANRHFLKDYGVWKPGHSQFSRLSLARCCEIAGIEFKGQAHRAMADVLATIDLLHYIANDR